MSNNETVSVGLPPAPCPICGQFCGDFAETTCVEDLEALPSAGGEIERLDVEMLKGGTWRLASIPDGLIVRYEDHLAHVTRLQAEVDRLNRVKLALAELVARHSDNCSVYRAELDALKAAQPQGEPVAWQTRRKTNRVGSNWTAWTQCSEMERALHSHEAGKFNRFGIMREIRPVYAKQPAPVAVVLPDDWQAWRMNPCKQGHRDVGAAGGVAHCYTCGEKIEAATTQEAFELWNAAHPSL
jgi:hypothetical protein